jgi:hypothetical protein
MCLSALIATALGVGGSLLKGKIDSDAAKDASNEQNQAALGSLGLQREGLNFQKVQSALALGLQREGLDFTKKTYDQARTDAAPWMKHGRDALSLYMKEMTGGGSLFRQQPGYQFQVQEGEKGVRNNLAALGMKNSGAALKALTRFRTGLADQSYGTYMDRLSNLAGAGGNAVSNINSTGSQTANAVNNSLSGMASTLTNTGNNVANSLSGMGGTLQDAGAARASGYVGSANGWGNALTSGVSNISNALGRYSTGTFPSAPSLGTTY